MDGATFRGNDPTPAPFIARSRPALTPAVTLGAAGVLCAWMLSEVRRVAASGAANEAEASLERMGLEFGTLLFGGVSAICLILTAIVLWRRLFPRDEIIVVSGGFTSGLFWGPGHLAWPQIHRLELRGPFLHVHGTDDRGRRRRLIVDTAGVDQPIVALFAAIADYRPDLIDTLDLPS